MASSTSAPIECASPAPTSAQVKRAIRYTYVQQMLSVVFGSTTSGMFLVGFAMALGADNIRFGLIMTVPQFFVVFQFAAAWLVERGWSRKKMTVLFACIAPLCWFFIAAIPLMPAALGQTGRIAVLIGVISLVTVVSQFSNNARNSWVGELIPAEQRGRFFGNCTMFAWIVGAVFAVAGGKFLDIIRSHGLLAFAALFSFGSLFGLASGLLYLPQPDCALPRAGPQPGFFETLRNTLRIRAFVALAIVQAVYLLNGIGGPFYDVYCLRDLGMSFFGRGVLNFISIVAILITSPLWGKMVDRFGCRPLLVLGLLTMAPTPLIFLAIPPGAWRLGYWLVPWTAFIGGAGAAAVSAAINTMLYKTSTPQGRSIQLAAYSVFVTLVAAPMPLVGGWLVTRLESIWHGADLRLTFYLSGVFMFIAAWLAHRLREPGATSARALALNYIPRRMAARVGLDLTPVYKFLPPWAIVPLPQDRASDEVSESPPEKH